MYLDSIAMSMEDHTYEHTVSDGFPSFNSIKERKMVPGTYLKDSVALAFLVKVLSTREIKNQL